MQTVQITPRHMEAVANFISEGKRLSGTSSLQNNVAEAVRQSIQNSMSYSTNNRNTSVNVEFKVDTITNESLPQVKSWIDNLEARIPDIVARSDMGRGASYLTPPPKNY